MMNQVHDDLQYNIRSKALWDRYMLLEDEIDREIQNILKRFPARFIKVQIPYGPLIQCIFPEPDLGLQVAMDDRHIVMGFSLKGAVSMSPYTGELMLLDWDNVDIISKLECFENLEQLEYDYNQGDTENILTQEEYDAKQ